MTGLSSPAATLAQIAARASVEKCLFPFRLSCVFLAISYGFDILKRCDEAFMIAVNYMVVDNVSAEVGCGETFLWLIVLFFFVKFSFHFLSYHVRFNQ